jgi:hypothetical protein
MVLRPVRGRAGLGDCRGRLTGAATAAAEATAVGSHLAQHRGLHAAGLRRVPRRRHRQRPDRPQHCRRGPVASLRPLYRRPSRARRRSFPTPGGEVEIFTKARDERFIYRLSDSHF